LVHTNKTNQNKTKQNKTKQNKTKQKQNKRTNKQTNKQHLPVSCCGLGKMSIKQSYFSLSKHGHVCIGNVRDLGGAMGPPIVIPMATRELI
jgi:hypothetical protein